MLCHDTAQAPFFSFFRFHFLQSHPPLVLALLETLRYLVTYKQSSTLPMRPRWISPGTRLQGNGSCDMERRGPMEKGGCLFESMYCSENCLFTGLRA